MKRVLLLNYEFPPLGGGASPVSYELAKRLSETGDFDIDVVTMGYKGLPEYEEINKNLRVHRVKSWRSKKEICHPWEQVTYLITGYLKCRELLKKNTYDICHNHFIVPGGVLAYVLKKQFDLPYILTSHGSDIPNYNPDRFKLLHTFTRPFLKIILNNAKAAVTGSQFLADLANKEIDGTIRYQVIREGFDSSKFTPQEKKKYILSTGRLLDRKGFQYLIKAVSPQDIGYEIHICGDGPMKETLEILAAESKTKIVFHGWIDNRSKEYKDLLEQSAIYVLASERENSSVSLLEAMSAGCATITTNVSGCPETIGNAGISVRPRNTSDLHATIEFLIENHEEMSKLERAARDRIRLAYNWSDAIRNYSSIL